MFSGFIKKWMGVHLCLCVCVYVQLDFHDFIWEYFRKPVRIGDCIKALKTAGSKHTTAHNPCTHIEQTGMCR